MGVPLEQEKENGSHVFWSVPKGWLPGARALSAEQVADCVRLLARLPKSAPRDALLWQLASPSAVPDAERQPMQGEHVLRVLEDALRTRTAVNVVYRSTTSGTARSRFLSVQRIKHGDRTRYVAISFEHDERAGGEVPRMKWYRLDRTLRASLAPDEPYSRRSPEEIDAFINGSVDGYRRGDLLECSFMVREPEAHWVAGNLPEGELVVVREDGWLHVDACTAGLDVLARHLAGLGDAVRILTPELKQKVEEIARRTLGVPNSAAHSGESCSR
jgi:predicted DNA-binding transcriptional regulator YafY